MQKVVDIIGFLSDQLLRGWAAFWVAKYLHRAYEANEITSCRYFFTTVYLSCVESAVLALSRMLLSYQDSIGIEYLLNCASQNVKDFPHADEKTILNSISSHKQQLSSIDPFLQSLRRNRDQTLAHLDRKYVTNPVKITSIPNIDMQEAEGTFRLVLKIINTYKGYAEDSELRLDSLETNIEDDLKYLIGLIDQANNRD